MTPYLPTGDPTGAPHVQIGKGLPPIRESRIVAHKPDPGEDPEKALLREAHLRFQRAETWDSRWREKSREQLNFVDGLQHWKGNEKDERKGRPCLTFDLIGPSLDQSINDMRQNPPEAKISPVGGKADKDTAEVLQGLLRNIEQDSDGQTCWMTAYEHALKIGRGWKKTSFEYENDDSFLQKIVDRRVANPFSIYPDPASEQFDYSDMRYLFATEDLEEHTFGDLYPNAAATSIAFAGVGDKPQQWFPRGQSIRVAEYWWVETERGTLAQLADGSAVPLDQVPPGVNVIATRKVDRRKVKGALLTGTEILEQWDWPGKWIPFTPILGREIIVDEKRQLRGQIEASMDANLQYDYMRSKEAESIGLAPISQWLVAEGSIEGHEFKWADANRKSLAYLEYKVKNLAGDLLPEPKRINSEQPGLVGITEAIAHAANDVKGTQATWDPNLGKPGPEMSGRAILAQQREGDNAHYNYVDNLRRSKRHDARIKIDLIPHIYSEARALTIYDPDGSVRSVQINSQFLDKGVQTIFRIGRDHIGADRYDVTIGTGPSYASRRAEGAQAMQGLLQSVPQPMMRCLDLVVKALDIPGGDEIADRLRPPDIQDGQEGQPPIPPQIQQKLAQDQQVIQHLMATGMALEQTLKAKILELESRERIATQTNQAKIEAALALSKSASMNKLAELNYGGVEHQLNLRADLLHDQMTIEQDAQSLSQQQQHEQQQQQQDQQHQQQLQQLQQQHEAQLAQLQQQHEQEMQANQPAPAGP